MNDYTMMTMIIATNQAQLKPSTQRCHVNKICACNSFRLGFLMFCADRGGARCDPAVLDHSAVRSHDGDSLYNGTRWWLFSTVNWFRRFCFRMCMPSHSKRHDSEIDHPQLTSDRPLWNPLSYQIIQMEWHHSQNVHCAPTLYSLERRWQSTKPSCSSRQQAIHWNRFDDKLNDLDG